MFSKEIEELDLNDMHWLIENKIPEFSLCTSKMAISIKACMRFIRKSP